MTTPWMFDGAGSGIPPVTTWDIERFLSGAAGAPTILAGPKGVGKTVLLTERATRMREQARKTNKKTRLSARYIFHPADESRPVEALQITKTEDTDKDWRYVVNTFESQSGWSMLFSYAFGFAAILNDGAAATESGVCHVLASEIASCLGLDFNQRKPTSIRKTKRTNIRSQISVNQLLNSMLNNWVTASARFSELYMRAIPLFSKMESSHAFFVDALDEANAVLATDDYVCAANDSCDPNSRVTDDFYRHRKYWIQIIVGLVSAVRDLNQKTSKITIYASIRSEAFNASSENELSSQQKTYMLFLKYSHDDLMKIFVSNIKAMGSNDDFREKLAFPELLDSDPLKAFIGVSEVRHSSVDETEKIFEALLRHTRSRPRDLMVMGHFIMGIEKEKRKALTSTDCQDLRTAIDKAGDHICSEFFLTSQPLCPRKRISKFLSLFKTNVIPSQVILCDSERKRHAKFLFAQGLLAACHQTPGNPNIRHIEFMDDSSIANPLMDLPFARWYAFHPVLYGTLKGSNQQQIEVQSEYRSTSKGIVKQHGFLRDLAILEVALNDRAHSVIKLNGARIQTNIAQTGVYKLWSLLTVLFVGLNTNKISWLSASRYIKDSQTTDSVKMLWNECCDAGSLAFFAENTLRNDVDAINRCIRDAMSFPSSTGHKHPMRISCSKADGLTGSDNWAESEHRILSHLDLIPVSRVSATKLASLSDGADVLQDFQPALVSLVGIEPSELRHHLVTT